MTFSRSTRGVDPSFLARTLVDCCLMRGYLSACLFVQLPFFIRLLTMFGLSCSERLSARVDSASQQFIFHLLACHVWALLLRTAICLRRFCLSAIYSSSACSPCLGPGLRTAICSRDSASRRYIYIFFIRLLAMFGPWAPNGYLLASIPPFGDIYILLSTCLPCLGPGLRAAIPRRIHYSALRPCSPPHGFIPLALRPKSMFYSPHGECRFYFSCPLRAIFLRPCGLNRCSIRLTANVDFIFLVPPHGEIDFLFASRRMSILFFSCPLTAKSMFYSPHGGCSFITLPPPCGDISFAPHGVNQFFLRLTARTDFIPPTR